MNKATGDHTHLGEEDDASQSHVHAASLYKSTGALLLKTL